jgi:Family of unknown function (DUF6221)
MTDIAEFLPARLDEDEELARRADVGPPHPSGFPRGMQICYGLEHYGLGLGYQGFVLVFDPAHVLRESGAKRALLAELPPFETIAHDWQRASPGEAQHLELAHAVWRPLAAPYADHPDFHERKALT